MASTDPHKAHPHHPDPDLNELLAGYVLGDLDERERDDLHAALAADPDLQRQLDELRLTLELLPLALPGAPEPPARLRQRLLGAEQQRRQPQGREQARRWRPRPAQLGLAAMACALVALGTQVLQLRGEMASLGRDQGAPALQASRTLTLRGTAGHPDLSGEVVVNPAQGHNLLLISGLPPAPAAHVYRLWANVGGTTKGCVQFVPNADGSVLMPIPTQPTSEAQGLSITLEPLRPDASTPHGPQLLTSV
ncbi:MAG: anti-sigma factor domain-containing protein [Cyanobacteriota bacterium]